MTVLPSSRYLAVAVNRAEVAPDTAATTVCGPTVAPSVHTPEIAMPSGPVTGFVGTSSVPPPVATEYDTCEFLIVILATNHNRAPAGFAGPAIGLALTLIHLISIPVTNTSVNPVRSTATALFVGGWAL
jgi:glycerol uptake facilitator-like aquaporin